MKTTITTLISVALLAGCATPLVPETRIVRVNTPIPFCPAPPTVARCTNYVDALTPEDAKNPGKVAQAYKLDMACYRANDRVFRQILERYADVSKLNTEVQQMFIDYGNVFERALLPEPSPTQ